jgi:hypothetical protein
MGSPPAMTSPDCRRSATRWPRTRSRRSATFLTRVHDRVLRTGLAEITDPSPPAPTVLRTADRAYQAAIDDLTREAGLAA